MKTILLLICGSVLLLNLAVQILAWLKGKQTTRKLVSFTAAPSLLLITAMPIPKDIKLVLICLAAAVIATLSYLTRPSTSQYPNRIYD